MGSIIQDVQAEISLPSFSTDVANQASSIGKVTFTPGGVCLNIARALRGLGHGSVRMVSAVGADGAGRELLAICARLGIQTDDVMTIEGCSTATVLCLFNGEGEVVFSLADVRVLEEHVTPAMALVRMESFHYDNGIVVTDGDLPSDVLEAVCSRARDRQCTVVFDPATVSKASRCVGALPYIDFVAPNEDELHEIARAIARANDAKPPRNFQRRPPAPLTALAALDNVPDVFFRSLQAVDAVIGRGARHVILTASEHGAGIYWLSETGIRLAHCPALPAGNIASVNGAGDCLVAGFISGLSMGRRKEEALKLGVACAWESLQTKDNVPEPFDGVRLTEHAWSLTVDVYEFQADDSP